MLVLLEPPYHELQLPQRWSRVVICLMAFVLHVWIYQLCSLASHYARFKAPATRKASSLLSSQVQLSSRPAGSSKREKRKYIKQRSPRQPTPFPNHFSHYLHGWGNYIHADVAFLVFASKLLRFSLFLSPPSLLLRLCFPLTSFSFSFSPLSPALLKWQPIGFHDAFSF